MIDYTKMSSGDLTHALGGDGQKFAAAFRQFHPDCNVSEGTLLAWFCSATMGGYDMAHGNPPQNGDHAEWLLEREGRQS